VNVLGWTRFIFNWFWKLCGDWSTGCWPTTTKFYLGNF